MVEIKFTGTNVDNVLRQIQAFVERAEAKEPKGGKRDDKKIRADPGNDGVRQR